MCYCTCRNSSNANSVTQIINITSKIEIEIARFKFDGLGAVGIG